MIAQVDGKKYYTTEEYLTLEIDADERHEYIDGEICPMTGGTPNHNKICGNLSAALIFACKRQPYQVFIADQRVWIPLKRIYTYPDVMVVGGELELQEGRKDTITNPLLIAEVLSASARSYDKDGKFAAYRTITNFQEYILIDQYRVQVEHYSKIDNSKSDSKRWVFTEYTNLQEIIKLNSLPFEISIEDIYDKVNFESKSE